MAGGIRHSYGLGLDLHPNPAGAIEIAKEMEPGQKVVTLACDSGLKYLGGNIYTWCISSGFS